MDRPKVPLRVTSEVPGATNTRFIGQCFAIVVETDRSLQRFSGGLVGGGLTGSITDWDMWATGDPSAAFHHQ